MSLQMRNAFLLRGGNQSFYTTTALSLRATTALTLKHTARFYTSKPKQDLSNKKVSKSDVPSLTTKSPLHRLSTTNLIRNVCLGSVFSSPKLYKFGISCLSWIADSKSVLFNPDKNVLLRGVLRLFLYNHFCAGVNAGEVRRTVSNMKAIGYTGVILCYGREIADSPSTDAAVGHSGKSKRSTGSGGKSKTILCNGKELSTSWSNNDASGTPFKSIDSTYSMVQQWKENNLATLKMIGANDYIALKFTGAGPSITKALADKAPIPDAFLHAVDEICQQAIQQTSAIWIDAEQQDLQPTIDTWTIDLMRRYNHDGHALIFNTIQAYLKNSPEVVAHHLQLAQHEGWSLGIKLVRGAYIGTEVRSRIHDTKAQTDECYNGIVRGLLTGTFPGYDEGRKPDIHLFLAGHNNESIRLASDLISELCAAGKKPNPVGFGQLQGMADDISCELLERAEQAKDGGGVDKAGAAPRVYKYMTWGTVQECMQYIVRRAVENEGAAERLKGSMTEMKAELKRRIKVF